MNPDLIWVVAGALQRADGLWLMHQRPFEKHHGGLWEFPGGKIEVAEKPKEALCRELYEELGIRVTVDDCKPLGFEESLIQSDVPAIVILLYRIARWDGEPAALEGESVGWFAPDEIERLHKPPLDQRLTRRLFERGSSYAGHEQ
ncbi:MAG: (deoxy)nucleoside triphosphate pyrophosphohydrolase [Pseudomonadota bacterium]